MIRIQAKQEDDTFNIEMEGHAGFNPGNDIVCSAASMLIQTLHASVLNGIGNTCLMSAEITHGKSNLSFRGGKDLFDMTVLGFKMLEKAYPDHVFIV